MPDITQWCDPEGRINFSANTPKGDTWMRAHYGHHTVELSRDEAFLLKETAKADGISVEPF